MLVVACIKQVPDTTQVQIDPVTNTLVREGIPFIVNPYDTHALEEALRLKDRFGCKVAAISMEYVDGWSLAAMRVDRAEQRYPLKEVTPWVRQLCAALTYAHTEAGVLHLALKPGKAVFAQIKGMALLD